MVGENATPQADWVPVVKCCGGVQLDLTCDTCGSWLPGNAHMLGVE